MLQDNKERVFDQFPGMDLGDVVLRELQKLDALDLLNYISDQEVHRFISEEDTPETLPKAEEEISYWGSLFTFKRSVYWGIALKDTNTLIGTCGFNMWSRTNDRAELSYDLARPYWGKGLMTRVLREVLNYAFTDMKINRLQATVATRNIGSIKVLEKLGFSRECMLKDYGCLRRKYHDSYMYALLRSDIEGKKL